MKQYKVILRFTFNSKSEDPTVRVRLFINGMKSLARSFYKNMHFMDGELVGLDNGPVVFRVENKHVK